MRLSFDDQLKGDHGMNCELIFNSSTKKCAVRNISQSVSEAWMTVDGTPLMPGKEDILHNDSLIKICASDGTETDIIAEGKFFLFSSFFSFLFF